MRWFGKTWDAPVNDPEQHVDTPVGNFCEWCIETIHYGDSGVLLPSAEGMLSYHRNCWLRQVVGSVAHQQGSCSCHGKGDEETAGLTRRQAADQAVDLFFSAY